MTTKYCYIDFEYKDSRNEVLNLVAVSYKLSDKDKYFTAWLHENASSKRIVAATLKALNVEGYEFVAFNVEAEARSFFSLGLDPIDFKWVDLYLEDRMLCNSSYYNSCGYQLIKGKIKYLTNNPAETGGFFEAQLGKAEHNLNAALYRWCKIKPDADLKKDMRFTILNTTHYSENQKTNILKYCQSDVELLEQMRAKQEGFVTDYFTGKINGAKDAALLASYPGDRNVRSRYAALTAKMVKTGYPVNKESILNFMRNLPVMYSELQEDINSQFDFDIFVKKDKTSKVITKLEGFKNNMPVKDVSSLMESLGKTTPSYIKGLEIYKRHMECIEYSMNQIALRDWISRSPLATVWARTTKGDFSLATDAFAEHFYARHSYEKGNLGEQILRYLKFKQSMNGFTISSKKRSIVHDIGDDGRVRCYFGIYGAQTSRSQPKATSFIFLKAAWLRGLVHTESKEKFICGCDYASQEVLIQACLSKDRALYNSYASGDVYLSFAKLAGAVPEEGKRADYKGIRDLFKSTFLGISYGMGATKLSLKLTGDTGKDVTVEDAKELINKFYKAYPTYAKYLKNFMTEYSNNKFQKLKDNWIIFGDNPRPTSVRNFPIQGNAAVIMREAVRLCHLKNIDVIFTLHDALYVEVVEDQIEDFKYCMKRAFINVLKTEWSNAIRLDLNAWGDFFIESTLKDKSIKTQVEYIDERSITEYNMYSKFFNKL